MLALPVRIMTKTATMLRTLPRIRVSPHSLGSETATLRAGSRLDNRPLRPWESAPPGLHGLGERFRLFARMSSRRWFPIALVAMALGLVAAAGGSYRGELAAGRDRSGRSVLDSG